MEVEYAEIEDRKVRSQLQNVGAIERQVTMPYDLSHHWLIREALACDHFVNMLSIRVNRTSNFHMQMCITLPFVDAMLLHLLSFTGNMPTSRCCRRTLHA